MNNIRYAFLELTRKCQLNCSHCYISENEREEKLCGTDWFKVLEKLKKFNVKKIVLLGGEPTQHPDFYAILSSAISQFEDVTVETNGVGKSYFGNYDCNISISFESCDPKENDLVRKFANSKESVYQLAVRKLIYGKKQDNAKICRFTLYHDSDVLGSIIMAEKLGANAIFMPLINQGNATKISYRVPNAKKIRESIEICMMSNEKLKGYHQVQVPQWYLTNIDLFNKFSPIFRKQNRICQAGVQRIFIDYSGGVFSCMFLPQFKFGNILKDKPASINKKINEFNKKIKEIKSQGRCQDCSAWEYCHGGCVAQYISNKSRMGENCPFTTDLNNHKTLLKGGVI